MAKSAKTTQGLQQPRTRGEALWWLILFVVTLGHPEKAVSKIGNSKSIQIICGMFLFAALLALYILTSP